MYNFCGYYFKYECMKIVNLNGNVYGTGKKTLVD